MAIIPAGRVKRKPLWGWLQPPWPEPAFGAFHGIRSKRPVERSHVKPRPAGAEKPCDVTLPPGDTEPGGIEDGRRGDG